MRIPQGVAFFDSGIGGLTVLVKCRERINEDFYYYGDNRHAPYGNLSEDKILEYAERAFDEFLQLNVKAAVIACNTVTAVCVEKLRNKYPFPIIGAEPAVLPAAKRGGETLVLTTRATYQSKRFSELCKQISLKYPKSIIQSFPCDALAGEIENHITEPFYDYSGYLPAGRPDIVVLGCTHYIYIKKQIEAFYHCPAVDGNEGIAERLHGVLKQEKQQAPGKIFFLGSGKKSNKIVYEQMFTKNG